MTSPWHGGLKRFLPWIIFGVFLIYLAAALLLPRVRSAEGFNLAEFGRLPVLMNGRVQPIDSVARMGLLQIRGTVAVPLENTPAWQLWRRTRTLSATEWLLEILAKPDAADARHVFPIQDTTAIGMLHLKAEGGSGPTYFTFNQLQPSLEEIGKQTARIVKVRVADRQKWEREWLKLQNAIVIYERLKNSLQPNGFLQQAAGGKPIDYDFAALLARYETDLRAGVKVAIARKQGKKEELDKASEERMRAFARPFVGVSRVGLLAMIPPADPTSSRDRWQNIGAVMIDSARTGQLPATVAQFATMSSAFAQGKTTVFNAQVTSYRQGLTARGLEPEVSKAHSEFLYNRFQPFVRATAIYLVGFALICASWFKRSTMLYRSAAMVVILAFVVHLTGLMFDMMVEGRLPLSNRYAMIIFAAWGVVLLGGVAERALRNGLGMATAALAGVIALAFAHNLAPGGAAGLMRAALDVSFWIAAVATIFALIVGGYVQPELVRPEIRPPIKRGRKAARWRFGQASHTQAAESGIPHATVASRQSVVGNQ